MDTPQTDNFDERLNQWVASQGFWFQVRYSLSGSGIKGRAMFQLLRIGFRLLVFLVIVAIGGWIYLLKRTDSAGFSEDLRASLESALSASEIQTRGIQHAQGQLEIGRLAAQGSGETFFDSLEARNIRLRMHLLDGLVGRWQTGTIAIARLEMDVKAGTDDAESAAKIARVVFQNPERVEANSYEIANATLRWGYSERTQGSIENSEMRAQRTATGWRLTFKDGIFRQNWLRQLEIKELVVLVEPGGLLFERAELKQGRGTVEFPGLRVTAGERPEVDGIVKLRNVDISSMVPRTLTNYIEGTISGDFKVFGSTNTSEGIGFEGQVVMDGKDVISVRDRIHLLKALSVVDYSRNYRRIDFREGAFDMRTHQGGMLLDNIDLSAEDLIAMQGRILVRLPTQQEIDMAVQQGTGLETSPLFISEDELGEARGLPGDSRQDFTLRRAAQEARRIQEGRQTMDSLSLFDRLGLSIELRRLQTQASERMSRMLRYEGEVRITLPGDAFERAPRLQELHPVDSGRLSMRVPIRGHLYELTLRQAEDIYQLGQR